MQAEGKSDASLPSAAGLKPITAREKHLRPSIGIMILPSNEYLINVMTVASLSEAELIERGLEGSKNNQACYRLFFVLAC